jgi:antirestriction protein
MSDFRMYAACLADYNNGHLHGAWIDLEGKDKDEIQEEIGAMLRASKFPNVTVDCPDCGGSGRATESVEDDTPCATCKGTCKVPSAEEWAAHDWEGDGLAAFGEYPDLDKVVEHVRLMEEHGEAWAAYVDTVGAHYATEEGFLDTYAGTFDTEADWAADYWEMTGLLEQIPENLRFYIDYEAYARDCRMGGDVSFTRYNGTLYVFNNH